MMPGEGFGPAQPNEKPVRAEEVLTFILEEVFIITSRFSSSIYNVDQHQSSVRMY